MLLGVPVSAGFVDKAAARLSARLGTAGFDGAVLAALAAEDVPAADETPVNVLDGTAPEAGEEEADPEERDGKTAGGAPHVLITRTPDGRLAFFQAIASRRKGSAAAAVPPGFAGHLITDGYTGYQDLLPRLAGIQQCCQHVIRRSGIIHNRLRDRDTGNHPGYALGCWLRDYKEQVFLFTANSP